MLTVETLISTINKSDLSFLKEMNLETPLVIGNQNGLNSIENGKYNNYEYILINSSEKGLSKNRNITIRYSTADICLLADDDISYVEGYSNTIIDAFEKNRKADVIIFNLFESPVERHIISFKHRVHGIEAFRYGSVRIAFRRESVINMIEFDERFGAGGVIPIGEDTIFLCDCLKKGLKVYADPHYILKLNDSESTWFSGFSKEYFSNKGKMYKRISSYFWILLCLQDSLRHRNRYNYYGNWIEVFIAMISGK